MELKASGRTAELARELCSRPGVKAWVVGGCVRDWLLGRATKDLDIISEGGCAALAAYCRRRYAARVENFDSFGTVRCFFPDGSRIDFARTRAEVYSAPAALPQVKPATLEKDLFRRDFTVNALAARPLEGGGWELLDPFCGVRDIEKGLLRVLHPASFRDDPTRLYRLCRFGARLGWKAEPRTEALMRRVVRGKLPGLLSRARLRQELLRILSEPEPAPAFKLLRRYGLDDFIYPGLRWTGKAEKVQESDARLGVLACALGAEGADFVSSLELERALCAELKIAAALCLSRRAPAKPLTKLQNNILTACFPRLPAAALRPCLVDGKMLQHCGLIPGRQFAEIIGAAAKVQWKGAFSTSAGARAWVESKTRFVRAEKRSGRAV